MSNTLKIPYILFVTVSIHISATSPSEVQAGERVPVETLLEKWRMLMKLFVLKVLFWTMGGIEAAAILLDQYITSRHFASWLARCARPTDFVLTPLSILGSIFIFTGTLIRWSCYRKLALMFTFDLSIRKDHKLVTTGPYSIVRHPSYSGLILVYVGMFLWYCTPGSWLMESGILNEPAYLWFFGLFCTVIAGILLALLARMSKEDALLKEVFGKQWDDWARRVPCSIIPGVY